MKAILPLSGSATHDVPRHKVARVITLAVCGGITKAGYSHHDYMVDHLHAAPLPIMALLGSNRGLEAPTCTKQSEQRREWR
jgi:hypothetical protein